MAIPAFIVVRPDTASPARLAALARQLAADLRHEAAQAAADRVADLAACRSDVAIPWPRREIV